MFNVCEEIQSALNNGNKILKECLKSYNEPYIYKIEFKNKSKSYWAKVGKNSKEHFGYFLRIGGLFELIPDESIARNKFESTIIHELIHTIPGCMNHGKKFKRICNLVNYKYPQYKIQTSSSAEDFGIVESKPKVKYKIICSKCGKEYLYERKPKLDINRYRCSICGNIKLELININ